MPYSPHDLADMHAAAADMLCVALRRASPPQARVALDLACGPGLKTDWLAAQLAPDGLLVGLDCDRAALKAASGARIAADALALPLRAGCCDLVWCVAALRLFADQQRALAEMCRIIRPDGTLIVALVEQRWVRPRAWPAQLAEVWRAGAIPSPPPADGLGDDLAQQLAAAGLAPAVTAWLLADPAPADQHLALLLTLADPAQILALPALSPPLRAECATIAASDPEPEPAPVLLIGVGRHEYSDE